MLPFIFSDSITCVVRVKVVKSSQLRLIETSCFSFYSLNVHSYKKVFRKDGPLEWYNDVMYPDASPDMFGQGIVSEVVEFTREEDRPRIIQNVESHGVMFLT